MKETSFQPFTIQDVQTERDTLNELLQTGARRMLMSALDRVLSQLNLFFQRLFRSSISSSQWLWSRANSKYGNKDSSFSATSNK